MDDILQLDACIPTPLHIVNRRAYPAWIVREDRREFHNMMLVVSGRGVCRINGEAHDMRAGQLFYHPMNQSFGYTTSDDQPLHCLGGNFAVHERIRGDRQDALIPVGRLPLERCSTPGSFAILARLFADLANAWNDAAPLRMIRCRSIMLRIFAELFRERSESRSPQRNHERIRKVADYMKKNYARKHTLAGLAGMARLTPSYFGQHFKTLTGETPMEYLNAIRIDKALECMAAGSSINEAASRCGFNDPFYFSRVFKQNKGMSPSQYLNRGELML